MASSLGPRFGYVFVLILSVAASAVHGATVSTCDEVGLRTAIAGGGSVTFACDGTIFLSATLVISNDVVLDGSGRTVVISGSNAVRVLSVKPGVSLTILKLTIADGRHLGTNAVSGGTNARGEAGLGAAIYNDGGSINLIDCTVTNNSVVGGNGSTPSQFAPDKSNNGGIGGGGA